MKAGEFCPKCKEAGFDHPLIEDSEDGTVYCRRCGYGPNTEEVDSCEGCEGDCGICNTFKGDK